MASPPPPLHENVVVSKYLKSHPSHRALLLLRSVLSASFLCYRILDCSHRGFSATCVTALSCEVFLAIFAQLLVCGTWFPVERAAHPARLIALMSPGDLPAVDIFVTTADPFKEPPLVTMNTVLSILAVEYPVEKVACYLSDDGGSVLTFWALTETAKFARKWVPFCKRFRAEPRAPSAYFNRKSSDYSKDKGFANALRDMKEAYDLFQRRLHNAVELYRDGGPEKIKVLLEGNTSWAAANNPRNHPGVFEIVVERAGTPDVEDALPCLTYISREKHPKRKHHFKAGAMNALTRVSGIMTNAPFILNLDCDMYVNDSKAILRAMCFFMDSDTNKQTSFVQFPQSFEGVDEDDIYGNNLKSETQIILKGMDGLQGPVYLGTGCFHKREVLYGQKPTAHSTVGRNGQAAAVTSDSNKQAKEMLGRSSSTLVLCAQSILGIRNDKRSLKGDNLTKEATELISCTYEDGTHWGTEIGWLYGSQTEDLLTGLKIHCRGWRSIYYVPSRPAFMGCAPTSSEDALTTRKRWSIGTLEILIGKNSPFLLGAHSRGLSLLQRIVYIWCFISPLMCFPLFFYAVLPAICLITRSWILPEVYDPAILLPICLFLAIYGINYYEHRLLDVGVKEWWNIRRMEAIVSVSSHVFATMDVLLKITGVSDTTFTLTPKDQKMSSEEGKNVGFVVNSSSPLFILPTVLVLMNGAGILTWAARVVLDLNRVGEGGGEAACAIWVLLLLWPFVNGVMLVGRGGAEAIRVSILLYSSLISALLMLLFCYP